MSAVPAPVSGNRPAALERTRSRMGKFFRENQVLGRRNAIGCVALEITQRCNLDCTLCYLSESSERVKDIPLEEVFRRLDGIHARFGAPTSVQITGGDPTLRKREELVAIVRRARELGLLPTLMTNGIKATCDMLEELAAAGLNDVAFHVDLTQERKGYATEKDLDAVRLENKVIRPMGDPRVHAALNCMARGCPRLPREPFRADMLDPELEASARYFFNEERNVRLEPDKQTVRLSQILQFYTDDFVKKASSLIAFVNKYREEKIPKGWKVEFIPYDWQLNSQSEEARLASSI